MTDWTTPEDVPEVVRERLHDWLNAGNPADAATAGERAVADIIRSFWPVPAPTLAEELRSWAEDASYDEDRDNLLHAADRAEQVEKERDEARAEVESLAEDLAGAESEVERLTTERGRLLAQVQGLARRDGCHNSEVRMLTEERDEALAEVESVRSELAEVTHARDSLREDYDHASAEVKRERDLGVALAHERDDTRAELERVRNAVDPKGAGLPPGMTISEAVQALIDGIPTGERVGLTDAQLKREYDLTEARAEVERLTAERDRLEAAQRLSDGSAWGGPIREPRAERLDRNPKTNTRVENTLRNLDNAECVAVPLPMPPGDIPGTALPINVMTVAPDQRANMQGILAGSPTDPADVKPGEAWMVECDGEIRPAVKDAQDIWCWCTVNNDGNFRSESNLKITLVSRLVPAPRVITNPDELERLAATSIIRDGRGWPGGITDQGVTMFNGFCAGYEEVLSRGPVTVLWEPEA